MDVLITKFENRNSQIIKLEELTKNLQSDLEQKIISTPTNYELKDTFFDDTKQIHWDGAKFTAIIPNTQEEIDEADEELKKNNDRKTGKKFTDFKQFREHRANQKLTNFKRKIEATAKLLLPKEQRNLCVQHLPDIPEFIEAIITDNFVVHVPVTDEADAFQIFETLNARGQTLSKSELIKNMCLRSISDETEAKKQNEKWNKIFDELIGESENDDTFIRESLRSRYFDEHKLAGMGNRTVPASTANLFRIMKEYYPTPSKVINYIQELEDDAKFISKLNDPLKLPRTVDDGIKDDLLAIKILGGPTAHARISIITAYRRWRYNNEFKEFVSFLVKFHFRNRTIGREAPGTMDGLMLSVAKMISDDTKSLDDVKNYLREKDIDDETFSFLFERYQIKDSSFGRYMLLEIEEKLNKGRQSDMRPLDKLTLEHILPQKSNEWDFGDFFDDWSSGSKQKKFESLTYEIGNMALLTPSHNSEATNHPFPQKIIDVYASESLKLNVIKKTVLNISEIVDNDDLQDLPELANDLTRWTANIIEKRTQKFAAMALEIWDLNE